MDSKELFKQKILEQRKLETSTEIVKENKVKNILLLIGIIISSIISFIGFMLYVIFISYLQIYDKDSIEKTKELIDTLPQQEIVQFINQNLMYSAIAQYNKIFLGIGITFLIIAIILIFTKKRTQRK